METQDIIDKLTLSAPVDIERMIRDFSIDLDAKADLPKGISGQIELSHDDEYRISANAKDSYYRRRFTMAHELAHYLLHRDLIGCGLDDDCMYRSTAHGNYYNTAVMRRHETQANQLAAQLLLPGRLLREIWESDKDKQSLAKKFQVSKQAMQIRLESLGLA